MPIAVSCPGCSARLNAPDAAAGKRVKCPKCQGPIVVPAAVATNPGFEVVEDEPSPPPKESAPAPAKNARVTAAADRDEEDDRPTRKRAKADDEDDRDEPAAPKRAKADQDDRRPTKKRAEADDEDDGADDRPRAKKRAAASGDEDDDRPRRKRSRDGDDDDRPRRKKKKSSAAGTSVVRNVVMGVVLLVLVAVAGVIYYVQFGGRNETASNTPPGDPPAAPPGTTPPGKRPPAMTPPDKRPPAPTTPSEGGRWQSDPQLDDRLGAYEDLAGFQVRPPKGYARQQPPANTTTGVEMFGWAGPKRADGITPSFILIVMTPPPNEPDADAPAEKFLGSLLEAIKRRRTGFAVTPTEAGEVGGRPFVRARWSGVANEPGASFNGKPLKGFVYAAKVGKQFVQASSQDLDPGGEVDLALAEAAALTLRKK
jgi:hypothetical protein